MVQPTSPPTTLNMGTEMGFDIREACFCSPICLRFSASRESKISFSRELKEDFCCQDWRAFKAGLKAFCVGKKWTDDIPPVHSSAVRRQSCLQQAPTSYVNSPQNPLNFGAPVGHGAAGGGMLYGSSAGVISVGGGLGGDDQASQAVLRAMSMWCVSSFKDWWKMAPLGRLYRGLLGGLGKGRGREGLHDQLTSLGIRVS